MPRHRNGGLRKVCGCPRRTWAKCEHPWHFAFKWSGVHHRFSLDKHLGKHIDNKTDAENEADNIRIAIREGRFGQPAPRQEMTLRQLADTYVERYVDMEHAATRQSYIWTLNKTCRTVVPRTTGGSAPLGDWRVTDIVTDTIERFREIRRTEGAGLGGVNRNIARFRALFAWALRVGYVEQTPFRRGAVTVVQLPRESPRSRRLNADTDEEARLLAVCAPHLRAVVECALETGMRRGEILSLQWAQVQGMKVEGSEVVWAPRAELVLPWSKTKTRRDRRIPISSRLKSILEMRRVDPAGQPMPAGAYVFGNAIGQQVKSVDRAWETAVLKAHGHTPTYTEKQIDDKRVVKTANLSPESRAALAAIDLHFHDLRREAGSRWLEGGVPLHTIRDWLGHTSIAQTSTYLAGTIQTQHDAMRQFEERRAALQPFATGSETEGRKRAQSALRQDSKPNKAGVGRDSAIM